MIRVDRRETAVADEFGLHEAIEHFTLSGDETALLRNKTRATRIGFAAMLKFVQWKGRFPRGRAEISDKGRMAIHFQRPATTWTPTASPRSVLV
jgi:hypothetical protein